MTITINNKTISDKSWSSVNKTTLKNKLLDAFTNEDSGAKSAIDECFAIVKDDGSNEVLSQDLWGPHHELHTDTLVLNRNGCHAALAAIRGARSKPDLSKSQLDKAEAHIKRHYKNDLKENFPQEAKAEVYTSSYNIPFDVDESILNDLKNELEAHGIPNINNIGVGITFARSLPYTNGNGLGITAKCIKNSLDTGRFAKFDFQHYENEIMGTMIGLKTYNDTVDLIPEKPMRVFGLGALYRKTLNTYNIQVENLPTWGTSLEVAFTDFDFWHKGKVVLKEDAPSDWLLNVDDIIEGVPYYSDNARVCMIAGGVDEDAMVNFNGNALTMNPADKESGILLAVAEHKYPIFDMSSDNNQNNKQEGEIMPFKQFETEAEFNTFVDSIKQETETQAFAAKQTDIDKMQKMMDDMKQKMMDMEDMVKNMTSKAEQAEASMATEKERADKAEAELQKQATAKLVSDRKQILASKNYPEDRISKKEDWLGKASQEDFDLFVEEIEALFASATKNLQAKAEQMGYKEAFASINLTGQVSNDNQEETNDKDTNILL